jgi:hypothetical protein
VVDALVKAQEVRMKKAIVMFLLSLCSMAAWAQESDWIKSFNVIWESRWHQSGYPLAAVRWPVQDKTIKYSINKTASSSNATRAREALEIITKVLEWKAIEVPEGSEEAQIEFTIRTYTVDELRQSVCIAMPQWRNWLYTKVRITLSEQYAYNCVLHELMHAFGYPGHPQGDTVLSYFEGNQRSLKPMDIFLLTTWYSDTTKVGISPFITADELTQQWVLKNVPADQQEKAAQAQKRWYQATMANMENFAFGKGEPPTILYRSGRLSEAGARTGRANIQSMLGAAYLNGWTVERDLSKAARLLLLGAQADNNNATGIMLRQLKSDTWLAEDAKPLCQWLKTAPAAITQAARAEQQAALESSVCKQALNP